MEMIKHPVCGHLTYEDRVIGNEPCSSCLKQIEKEHASKQPHPECGCLKPIWAHRKSGPCDWCVTDVSRDYEMFIPPKESDYIYTIEDVRTMRSPLLLETDWVDNNPGRVSRENHRYVEAIKSYRQKLFDITNNFKGVVYWPEKPDRLDFNDVI